MIFADDISQIIENHDNDKEEMAVQSEREIVRVNEYEKLWKIKTNATKFKMISVSKTQPYPIGVNDNIMPFTNDINLLGLTLTRTGFVKHIHNKINQAKHQSLKPKRFYQVSPQLQIRLYTTLIRLIMEYPPIPNALASKSLTLQMQRVQNRALHNAVRNTEDRYKTVEELHNLFQIEPLNIRLYNRLQKTWNKIQELDVELCDQTEVANNNNIRDHSWWPRVGHAYVQDPPDPMYTHIN